MDRVFLGLAGLLLPIPRPSPASPWKTLSIPPLILGLIQYQTKQNKTKQTPKKKKKKRMKILHMGDPEYLDVCG